MSVVEQEPELVVERRIRLAGKKDTEAETFKATFTIRIWRLAKGTPAGTPRWMSSFRVDNDLRGLQSSHIPGKDDFEALAHCLAYADNFLAQLKRGGFDVWISESPEYSYDPSASLVAFRETPDLGQNKPGSVGD